MREGSSGETFLSLGPDQQGLERTFWHLSLLMYLHRGRAREMHSTIISIHALSIIGTPRRHATWENPVCSPESPSPRQSPQLPTDLAKSQDTFFPLEEIWFSSFITPFMSLREDGNSPKIIACKQASTQNTQPSYKLLRQLTTSNGAKDPKLPQRRILKPQDRKHLSIW